MDLVQGSILSVLRKPSLCMSELVENVSEVAVDALRNLFLVKIARSVSDVFAVKWGSTVRRRFSQIPQRTEPFATDVRQKLRRVSTGGYHGCTLHSSGAYAQCSRLGVTGGLGRFSQLLEETEHFCRRGQQKVAKIVQCGDRCYRKERAKLKSCEVTEGSDQKKLGIVCVFGSLPNLYTGSCQASKAVRNISAVESNLWSNASSQTISF